MPYGSFKKKFILIIMGGDKETREQLREYYFKNLKNIVALGCHDIIYSVGSVRWAMTRIDLLGKQIINLVIFPLDFPEADKDRVAFYLQTRNSAADIISVPLPKVAQIA